jgi:arginine deiminase
MHRPGAELALVTESTLREFNFDAPVDELAFLAEYGEMAQQFAKSGVDCVFLTDVLANDADSLRYIAHRPNMTYTRDLAAVFSKGAVLMGPHLRGRWGDQHIVGRALERLGIPIHGAIECPAFLEGGGTTMIGSDTIVASICDRANQCGTAALRDLVLGTESKYFLEVPLPFGHVHIDGVFMTLDEKLAIYHAETLSVFPCVLYEAGRSGRRHIMFAEFLDERGIEPIPITDAEKRGGDLNIVVTKQGRRAIGFSSAKRLGKELTARGWEMATFPSETLFKGNGGAHCMTCPVHVT